MRPIDADKFKENLMKLWDYSCVDGVTATDVLKRVILDLDNAPTVTPSLNLDNITEEDIEKFKIIWQRATSKGLPAFVEDDRARGKWIVDEDDDLFNFKKCSNCSEVAEFLDGGSQFLSKFCPNCGADMRGENDSR